MTKKEKIKKIFSAVGFAVTSFFAVIMLLLGSVLAVIAFSPEIDTVCVFGNKVYVAETDIPESNIKRGSLVIAKSGSDQDEITDILNDKSRVKIIKNGGKIISVLKHPAMLCTVLVLMLLFYFLLLFEIKKAIIARTE